MSLVPMVVEQTSRGEKILRYLLKITEGSHNIPQQCDR